MTTSENSSNLKFFLPLFQRSLSLLDISNSTTLRIAELDNDICIIGIFREGKRLLFTINNNVGNGNDKRKMFILVGENGSSGFSFWEGYFEKDKKCLSSLDNEKFLEIDFINLIIKSIIKHFNYASIFVGKDDILMNIVK